MIHASALVGRLSADVGGGARLRVLVLLAGVLGLSAATHRGCGRRRTQGRLRGGQRCDRSARDSLGGWGVVAVAFPAVASVLGNLIPATERGRIYGFVLTGELVGALSWISAGRVRCG